MEWKAKWIWYPERKTLPNSIMKFRKLIYVESNVKEAKAFVSADSRYRLYINGKYIVRGPAPYDPMHMHYDIIDIGPYLKKGKNIIAILGYYIGISTNNYIRPQDLSTTAAIIFQCYIEYENNKLEVVSDRTWRVKRSKAWRNRTNDCAFAIPQWNEVFDARDYEEKWIEVEFNDSVWKDARELNISPGRPTICSVRDDLNTDDPTVKAYYSEMQARTSFLERDIELLKEEKVYPVSVKAAGRIHWNTEPENFFEYYEGNAFDIIEVKEINKDTDNYLKDLDLKEGSQESSFVIFDFEEDLVGRPFFSVEGKEGAIIEITTAETVDKLFITPEERRNPWSRYICKDGYQEFELNDYFVFRYVQVMIRSTKDSLKIKSVGAVKQSYPHILKGSFECSDKDISSLWNIGVNTVSILSQDTYISEARERQQYAGESTYGMLAIYYAFGGYRYARKYLTDMGNSQHPTGLLLGCWPSGDRLSRIKEAVLRYVYWKPHLIELSMRWVIAVWDYYLYSGDRDLLAEFYPKIQRIRERCHTLRNVDSSLINTAWDVDFWMDHVGFEHKNGLVLCANCLYYGMLKTIGLISGELDDRKYKNDIKEELKKIKDELIDNYWSDTEKVFVYQIPEDNKDLINFLTNTIALYYKIVPEGYEKSAAKRIFEDKSLVTPTPPLSHHSYLTSIEYDNGRYFLNELKTKWSRQSAVIENKTFPELFDEDKVNYPTSKAFNASLNPTYILSSEILGVKPVECGFRKFIVAPKTGGLKWAKGDIPTPNGTIRVSWKVEDEEIDIEVSAPEKYELEKEYGKGTDKTLIFSLKDR
jgi:alpha-L-rhamnosidase